MKKKVYVAPQWKLVILSRPLLLAGSVGFDPNKTNISDIPYSGEGM